MNDKTIKQKITVTTDVDIEYTLKIVNGETEVVIHGFNVDVDGLKNKVEADLIQEPMTSGEYLGYKLYEGLASLFTGGTQ